MVFSSLLFLFCFLPPVLSLAILLTAKGEVVGNTAEPPSTGLANRSANLFLLLASLGFYAWGEQGRVLLLVASILGNYLAGLAIATSGTRGHAKLVLALSLIFNLGLLGVYKYTAFLAETLTAATGSSWGLPQIALPLGISFFTFQALSYVIDVYRGFVPATKSPIDFGCYVALFPQLVAGPIVRYTTVAEDLLLRRFSSQAAAEGAARFIRGLAKKVLIANIVAAPADAIFSLPPEQLTASLTWFAALCYTLQIYYDFSGYSDMAIGLGRILGFRFPENFAHPYAAVSVRDFWRRWHISLSTWFRDYLYIPLGGNRRGNLATARNLLLVFFLCGLWHGASWTFVAWGLFHGFFLVAERSPLGAFVDGLPRPLANGYALLVALLGWVLFRAETFGLAAAFYAAMFTGGAAESGYSVLAYADPLTLTAIAFGLVFSWPVASHARGWLARHEPFWTLRLATTAALFGLCLLRLAAGTHNPFIYFRF